MMNSRQGLTGEEMVAGYLPLQYNIRKIFPKGGTIHHMVKAPAEKAVGEEL